MKTTRFMALLATLTLAPASGLCQTPTGALSGAIVDSVGASLPHARVSASRPETGVRRSVLADDEGHYLLASLDPGTYEILVERNGFADARASVTVQVGDHLTADFVLEVAGVTERVEVPSRATSVNTVDYRVAGSVTRTQIETVPLNGRSFLDLAQLQPSVQVI